MSKEQTPIDWLKQKLWQRAAIERKDFELFDEAIKKEKEFNQAKVLEALEREVVKFSKYAFKEAKEAVIWSSDYPIHVANKWIEENL